MLTSVKKLQRRARRTRYRLRKHSQGYLRLSVHRSLKHISAQVIEDSTGRTLASASTLEAIFREGGKSGGNVEAAGVIGKWVAERALKAGIERLMFDRGGYLYHGRVRALAEAARAAGLKF